MMGMEDPSKEERGCMVLLLEDICEVGIEVPIKPLTKGEIVEGIAKNP